MLTKVKTIRSHTGLARFLAGVEDTDEFVLREHTKDIPSPYAYSPTKRVFLWNGRKVVFFETRHRHYEVFDVTDVPTEKDEP